MPYFVEINGVPDSPQRVAITGNSNMIGSSADCQINITHEEVPDHALLLDIRGKDFWVQNLNPYSIYVGMEEVTPNAWGPWTAGETVQLTKSVSLTLTELLSEDAEPGEVDGEDGKTKLDGNKIAQIVLIVACFVGAPLLLFTDKNDVAGEIDKRFNFNQVVLDLAPDADRDIEYRTVRKYLQQAWMADRRFRNRRPSIVRKSYELLVNHRLVRNNPDESQTLAEIEDYATRRLAALRFRR